jgi:hypothetical protein
MMFSTEELYENTVIITHPLRLLGALKYIPTLPNQARGTSFIFELLLNLAVPCVFMLAFALGTYNLIWNDLAYRCVPIDSELRSFNPAQRALGIDYFKTEYNTDFCGYT